MQKHDPATPKQANRSSTLHARRWELCGGCIQRRLRQAPWMVSQLQRQSAAHIQIGRTKVADMAEEPSAGERERLWAAWLKENPLYQGQQEKTARTLHCSTKNLTGRHIQLAVRNSWWASLPRRLAGAMVHGSLQLAIAPPAFPTRRLVFSTCLAEACGFARAGSALGRDAAAPGRCRHCSVLDWQPTRR